MSFFENGWVFEFASILLLALALHYVFNKVLTILHHRFQSQNELWQDSAVLALTLPLACLIWFLASVYAINLFSEKTVGSIFIPQPYTVVKIASIIAVSWFLLRWKKTLVLKKQQTTGYSPDFRKIDAMNKIATLTILITAILLILEQTGSSMNSLIALGGIGGLALAFASQQLISNFFGGFMIYFTQPFGVGDMIMLPEKHIEGSVEEIGWYTTQIKTLDKRPLYIPNSLLANALVMNVSRISHRQFKCEINLRNEDLPKLTSIISSIQLFLNGVTGIDHTFPTQVYFTGFGTNGLELIITAYTQDMGRPAFLTLSQELLLTIAQIISDKGAQIAGPIPFTNRYP